MRVGLTIRNWLMVFERKISGESLDVSETTVESWMRRLRKLGRRFGKHLEHGRKWLLL